MELLLILSDYSFPNIDGPSAQIDYFLTLLSSHGVNVNVVIYKKDTSHFDTAAFAEKFAAVSVVRVFNYKGTFISKAISLSLPNEEEDFFLKLASKFCRVILVGFAVFPLGRYFRKSKVLFNCMDAWSFRMLKLSVGFNSFYFVKYAAAFLISYTFELIYSRYVDCIVFVSDVEVNKYRFLHPFSAKHLLSVSLFSGVSRNRAPLSLFNKCLIWGDVGVPFIRQGVLNIVPVLAELSSPGFQIDILGRQPNDSKIAQSIKMLGVNYIDWLDDLVMLQSYDFVVIPDSNGSGIKNRIINCFCLGVPVAASSQAFAGFPEYIKGLAVSVYEPENIKECLAEMFRSSHLIKLSDNALNYVKTSHDNEIIYKVWSDLLFCEEH